MKKLFCLLMCFICIFCLTACDEKENEGQPNVAEDYVVYRADFFIKKEGDEYFTLYDATKKDYTVGDTIYLKLIIDIKSKVQSEKIDASLVIPNSKNIDSFYVKGDPITPDTDIITKINTYNLKIATNSVEPCEMIFEFKSLDEERTQVVLAFEEKIDKKYNEFITLNFKANKEQTNK